MSTANGVAPPPAPPTTDNWARPLWRRGKIIIIFFFYFSLVYACYNYNCISRFQMCLVRNTSVAAHKARGLSKIINNNCHYHKLVRYRDLLRSTRASIDVAADAHFIYRMDAKMYFIYCAGLTWESLATPTCPLGRFSFVDRTLCGMETLGRRWPSSRTDLADETFNAYCDGGKA